MEETLVTRARCAFCGENYMLRGRKYAQLIEMQDALKIVMRPSAIGPQRTCMNFVPMSETIRVCLNPCWVNECDRELARYAHAPLAAEAIPM
jgi:hypothetical protein